MKSLFDIKHINNMELKNRFVRSATWENMATAEGHMTEKLFKVYEDLAKGGVGLIISSYSTIFEYDKPSPNMLGIYDDCFIDEYKKLTDMVHGNNCKIAMQIVHGKEYKNLNTGLNSFEFSNEFSKEDIKNIINAFGDAAYRAKQAGFDGVQIHGAHGYFLSRTLSPIYNTRTDEYGGSVENRGALILKVYDEVRNRVGKDFNIFIKINCSDFEEGGATIDECSYVCEELDKRDIDAIEVSGGGRIWASNTKGEAIYKEYAENIAAQVNVPIMLVGINRSVENMDKILNSTEIEYFSMSRPFICEPDLINKWLSGATTKSTCVSCGKCFLEQGVMCIFNR